MRLKHISPHFKKLSIKVFQYFFFKTINHMHGTGCVHMSVHAPVHAPIGASMLRPKKEDFGCCTRSLFTLIQKLGVFLRMKPGRQQANLVTHPHTASGSQTLLGHTQLFTGTLRSPTQLLTNVSLITGQSPQILIHS